MSKAERMFMSEIDARFPYNDWDRCIDLIDRGVGISPNAAFGVLHELCVNRPRNIPSDQLMQLLRYWRSHFEHPVADMLACVAASMIHGQELIVDDVIAKMQTLAQYPGLYAALSVLYFACNDIEGKMEPINAAIRKTWDAIPDSS